MHLCIAKHEIIFLCVCVCALRSLLPLSSSTNVPRVKNKKKRSLTRKTSHMHQRKPIPSAHTREHGERERKRGKKNPSSIFRPHPSCASPPHPWGFPSFSLFIRPLPAEVEHPPLRDVSFFPPSFLSFFFPGSCKYPPAAFQARFSRGQLLGSGVHGRGCSTSTKASGVSCCWCG